MQDLLRRLGLSDVNSGVYASRWIDEPEGSEIDSINPATAETLARVRCASRDDYEQCVEKAQKAFTTWRMMPPPQRGEIIRQFGQVLREHKKDLGLLVTMEVGKIVSEGEGEVQEMIDMCDFAVGLSRQLYGLTMASERPSHRLFEQWHPLGPVGIITAFNFPVAVWAWNAAVAAVCGDTMIWKPSPEAPLTAIAVQHLINRVATEHDLDGVFNLCIGCDASVGRWMAEDRRLPLISATGSYAMGRSVGQAVGARLGRSLLELGGNNAIIVTETADLDLVLRAVLFAAVGTSGQRCTTLRRLILHEAIASPLLARLVSAYQSIKIGDPAKADMLMGPLINEAAVDRMLHALNVAREQGGQVLVGGERIDRPGHFITPAIVRAHAEMPIVAEETFAPILYTMTYNDLDQAIATHNSVEQGLSSAIFTDRLAEAERFLSPTGSDCGIANVNIGTSGAEIGGAFGGEKDTGGGREAGSDAWKAYMRRQTCTINYGTDLPLAQGVEFDVPSD
ncbi:MAG: aldehyde dehydrogenase family protein [Planctomycetaceae bacterium]|nr:aldehyde dehydrogenase family protein [Planctomycetaceae bacterium]